METEILSSDRLVLSFSAVIQRPKNHSFFNFSTLASLSKESEIKTTMDGHDRQTIKLNTGEEKTFQLVGSDFCDFIALNSSGLMALQLTDETSEGFGKGFFGSGTFGGESIGDSDQGIKGLFVAQGKFTNLTVLNLDSDAISIDLIAIKFEV